MALDTAAAWEEFSGALRGFIFKQVSDEDIADDILQDTFIKIHQHLGQLKDESKLRSWLYQLTRNTIMDYFRQRRFTVELPEETEHLPDNAELSEEISRDLAPCVKALMARLPAKDSQAIELTEFDGMTQKELSEKLEMSFSGAKSRVQRAKGKMKNLLQECCTFELDRRGNILAYQPNSASAPGCCGDDAECLGEQEKKIISRPFSDSSVYTSEQSTKAEN